MAKIPRKKCSMCGTTKKVTKMEKEKIPSLREGVDDYEVWTCNACLGKKKPEPEPVKHEPKPKPKPIEYIHEPYPQSIKSDKKFKGYKHQNSMENVLIGNREDGVVTLDFDRLPTNLKAQLAAGIMKWVREQTGGHCYMIDVEKVRFRYKVKHAQTRRKE